MNLLLRLVFGAWISVTLVSCSTASSAASLLMSPVAAAARTITSLGRLAGTSASVDDPDSSSKSVAERGKVIESRGSYQAPEVAQTSVVAQR